MVSPIPLYQLTCRISVAWNPCNFGHADDDQITFLHSAALGQAAPLGTANIGNFLSERSGQVDLMVLLLHEDLANLLRHREFTESFALPDAIAIIEDGFVFIIKIEA